MLAWHTLVRKRKGGALSTPCDTGALVVRGKRQPIVQDISARRRAHPQHGARLKGVPALVLQHARQQRRVKLGEVRLQRGHVNRCQAPDGDTSAWYSFAGGDFPIVSCAPLTGSLVPEGGSAMRDAVQRRSKTLG